MDEHKKVLIEERRHRPTISLRIGNREHGLDSLKGVIALGSVITILYGGLQFAFKVLDLRVGRGAEAKIEALDKRTAREDSISHIERATLFRQASETHQAIQGLTLVVCAAVSEKSSTLTRIKCDEALRASTGNP